MAEILHIMLERIENLYKSKLKTLKAMSNRSCNKITRAKTSTSSSQNN